LENIVEFAFVKCQGHRIERRHLPHELTASARDIVAAAFTARKPLKALERELIRRILQECNEDPRTAAKRLGISRTTLWRKLRGSAGVTT
jgi:transcriptional regulator of acetoin/glycerol metabolism